ncbi:hypothetical protein AB0M46_15420 [Dactylosporangium sp. NPDC051485]
MAVIAIVAALAPIASTEIPRHHTVGVDAYDTSPGVIGSGGGPSPSPSHK